MGDDERTLICMWLAAGLVVTGVGLPLAQCRPTMLFIAGIVGTSLGVLMLGIGIALLIRRSKRYARQHEERDGANEDKMDEGR